MIEERTDQGRTPRAAFAPGRPVAPSTVTEAIVTGRGRGTPGAGRRRSLIRYGHGWWALPAVIAIGAALYGATAVGGFFAFTDWSGIGAFQLVGVSNFLRIFQDPLMVTALVNTLVLAAGFVVGSTVIGLALALALNRGVRSRHVLRTLLFMPVVLSPLAVSYLWRFVFEYDGPLNGLLGALGLEAWQRTWLADPHFSLWVILFVMIWQATGISMIIFLTGLTTVPVEIEEAAALDGAGAWGRFRHVVLPQLRPSLGIALTLGTVQGLRAFDQILALTGGGPGGATETMSTQVYKQAFTLGDFGYGAAIALTLTVVIVIFAVLQQVAVRPRND